MTASVGAPALTMMMIVRGEDRESTNSCVVYPGTNVPSSPNSSTRAFVLASVRLWTAVT